MFQMRLIPHNFVRDSFPGIISVTAMIFGGRISRIAA